MKQIIEKRTELERKFKAKQQELDNVLQQIAEINNTDFLEMTFDMYVKKSALQDYHHNQSDQLQKRVNEVRFNNLNGNMIKIITSHIRQQADDCPTVSNAFSEFERSPNDRVLKEVYYSAFNEKVDELHTESINMLGEYFSIVGKETEQVFKNELKRELPAAITVVEIETNAESVSKGVPYDYANRKSTRK